MNTLDASLLRQAAAAAAGDQSYPAAALYVVATPIGNRADITLRALHVLGLVDAIACEDTRHSQTLLRPFGIDKPLIALHRHNEQAAASAVLARLGRGERVAYVSDAGTPAVSDPGAGLVAAAREAGYRVVPVPGPSSASALVSVAGDASAGGFHVAGFLPARGGDRARALERALANRSAVLLFEAPHRIAELSQALAERRPSRVVSIGRELTKQFETVATMRASDLPGWLDADPNRVRGEFVVMLHGEPPDAGDEATADHDRVLRSLLAVLPLKQAVATAVALGAGPKNRVYERALQLQPEVGSGTPPTQITSMQGEETAWPFRERPGGADS